LARQGYNRRVNTVHAEQTLPGGQRIQLIEGDITAERVDAIVNAANADLRHGGGVAGAISRKGGPWIQAESFEWVRCHGRVTHARPAWTSAGTLQARHVIHAVGPIWGEGDEDRKLAEAILGSLRVADELELKTLALPAISTGTFGFPPARAAALILGAIKDYFSTNPASRIERVGIVLLDLPALELFRQRLGS